MTLRTLTGIGLLICAATLASAYYIEYQFVVSPCPMCQLQRAVFMALGITFLIGVLIKIKSVWRYLYCALVFLISSLGFGIAARQMWLQYYAPPQKLSCAASIERLIDVYPFLEALKIALTGSTDCAKIDFTLFGISLAGWAVVTFGLISIVAIYAITLVARKKIS